jgi:hypothetical protein
MFLNWESLWCPCCGYRLRTKPRNPSYKEKVREANKAKIKELVNAIPEPPKSNVQLTQEMIAEMDAIEANTVEEPRRIAVINGDGTVTYQEVSTA